jgi:DNA-formamidopyrimidine glycosylase
MPEIAEVALMSDAIREIANHKRLVQVEVLGGRYLKGGQISLKNYGEFNSRLPLTVESVNVRGKFCWLMLDQGWYIGITFGMAGGIYYQPNEDVLKQHAERTGKLVSMEEYMKHFHVRFLMENQQCFYFGDARHFGTITLSNDPHELQKKLDRLGPDMLTGQPIADAQFVQIFRRPKFGNKNICVVLMGQEAISGVGNYIKAEALYACRISPWALVSDLDDTLLVHLYHNIREIAQQSYQGHGASLYTYTGTRKEKGSFQDLLKVYGKQFDPEGRPVVIIPEHQSPDKRTTHYVPTYQSVGQHRNPPSLCGAPSLCGTSSLCVPQIKLKPKLTLKLTLPMT